MKKTAGLSQPQLHTGHAKAPTSLVSRQVGVQSAAHMLSRWWLLAQSGAHAADGIGVTSESASNVLAGSVPSQTLAWTTGPIGAHGSVKVRTNQFSNFNWMITLRPT